MCVHKTQGLLTSRLSSTPGSRGFEIRVFLLLDRLPTRADELYLPEAAGFRAPVIRLSSAKCHTHIQAKQNVYLPQVKILIHNLIHIPPVRIVEIWEK